MVDPDWQHAPHPPYPAEPSAPEVGPGPPRPAPAAPPPAPPPLPQRGGQAPPPTARWHRTQEGGDELIALAYEAATARLASQTSAFESLRTRASGILGVATLVTSFSAGLGLFNQDPATGRVLPGWAPWTLLALLLALGSCAFVILLPTRQWLHGPSARIIMDAWARGATHRQVMADVTAAMVEAQRRNSEELGRRSRTYRAAVLLLLAQVLTLVVAVFQSSTA